MDNVAAALLNTSHETLLINSFKTEGRGLKRTNYILGNNVLLIVSTKMYVLNYLGQVFKTFHGFSFLSSVQVIISKQKKIVENPGIDPGTPRMRSGRSTIWANSPTAMNVSF